MARVFEGQRTFLHPILRWLEVLTYKAVGVKEDVEQRWTQYTASLLSFSIFGFLLVYFIQRAQAYLPFNPQNFGTPNVTPLSLRGPDVPTVSDRFNQRLYCAAAPGRKNLMNV